MYKWVSNIFLVSLFTLWMWLSVIGQAFVEVPTQVIGICVALASGNIGAYVAEKFPREK